MFYLGLLDPAVGFYLDVLGFVETLDWGGNAANKTSSPISVDMLYWGLRRI